MAFQGEMVNAAELVFSVSEMLLENKKKYGETCVCGNSNSFGDSIADLY